MQKSCFWVFFLNCGEKKKKFESDVNDGSRQKGNCWEESNYRIHTLDPFVLVFNIGINNSEITLWAICGLRCAINGKQDTDRGYLEKVYLTSPPDKQKIVQYLLPSRRNCIGDIKTTLTGGSDMRLT